MEENEVKRLPTTTLLQDLRELMKNGIYIDGTRNETNLDYKKQKKDFACSILSHCFDLMIYLLF